MNKPTRGRPNEEKAILVMVIEAPDGDLKGQDYADFSPERALDLPERSLQSQRH